MLRPEVHIRASTGIPGAQDEHTDDRQQGAGPGDGSEHPPRPEEHDELVSVCVRQLGVQIVRLQRGRCAIRAPRASARVHPGWRDNTTVWPSARNVSSRAAHWPGSPPAADAYVVRISSSSRVPGRGAWGAVRSARDRDGKAMFPLGEGTNTREVMHTRQAARAQPTSRPRCEGAEGLNLLAQNVGPARSAQGDKRP